MAGEERADRGARHRVVNGGTSAGAVERLNSLHLVRRNGRLEFIGTGASENSHRPKKNLSPRSINKFSTIYVCNARSFIRETISLILGILSPVRMGRELLDKALGLCGIICDEVKNQLAIDQIYDSGESHESGEKSRENAHHGSTFWSRTCANTRFFIKDTLNSQGWGSRGSREHLISNTEISEYSSRARLHISEMLLYASESQTTAILQSALEPVGELLLEYVKRYGVRIVIVDGSYSLYNMRIGNWKPFGKGEKLFDGRDFDFAGGVYCPDQRLIIIRESRLLTEKSVAIHEFAHALDYAIKDREKLSFEISVRLWYLFQSSRKGWISWYGSQKPVEYFAESFSAYFKPEKHVMLQELDPQMYEFIEVLIWKGALAAARYAWGRPQKPGRAD